MGGVGCNGQIRSIPPLPRPLILINVYDLLSKEKESASARERLKNKLCQIEQELATSREELSSLREELRERNERSEKETLHLQQERGKSKSLHQVCNLHTYNISSMNVHGVHAIVHSKTPKLIVRHLS